MNVDIAAICLDVENFRHAKVSHERDAIRMLLGDEKTHRVSELAQDIVDQGGLDPSSRLIITEKPDEPGRYIALEGNRRITALKAMMTPELAEGLSPHPIFKALHSKFVALGLKQVDCVVLNRADASVWIKRKHYKGMGGKGTMAWNAVATARSDASEGRYTRWMTSLAFIESHGIDAEDVRDRIAGKTTTVERVLTSTHISNFLGLQFDKSGIVEAENGDEEAAVRLLQALLQAMAEPGFKETVVSSSDQQKEWLERFSHLSVKKPAGSSDTGSLGQGANGDASAANGTGSQQSSGTAAAANASAASTRSKAITPRKNLADKGLQISNSALNKFYGELKKLSVEKNPFVCAAVIRVFLEKSTTHFLEEVGVPTLNTSPGATWHDYGVKLRDKVASALKEIDPSGSAPELSAVRDVANGQQGRLHTLDQLNKAIHDHQDLPAGSELLTIWDRFHPYFKRLFQAVETSKS